MMSKENIALQMHANERISRAKGFWARAFASASPYAVRRNNRRKWKIQRRSGIN